MMNMGVDSGVTLISYDNLDPLNLIMETTDIRLTLRGRGVITTYVARCSTRPGGYSPVLRSTGVIAVAKYTSSYTSIVLGRGRISSIGGVSTSSIMGTCSLGPLSTIHLSRSNRGTMAILGGCVLGRLRGVWGLGGVGGGRGVWSSGWWCSPFSFYSQSLWLSDLFALNLFISLSLLGMVLEFPGGSFVTFLESINFST